MVEISGKYKIGTRRFGSINWIGAWTLYKKEVLRFLIVWIQTLFSPLITSLLFLSVLSLAIGLTVFFLFYSDFNLKNITSLIFIGLAALTVPHMLLRILIKQK